MSSLKLPTHFFSFVAHYTFIFLSSDSSGAVFSDILPTSSIDCLLTATIEYDVDYRQFLKIGYLSKYPLDSFTAESASFCI